MGAPGDPPALRLCSPAPPLQGFYDQVANPLLVDVELLYPQDTVSALTQHRHKQYYEGSEIMVAGRIADHKSSSFKADVLARGVNTGAAEGGEVRQHPEAPNPHSFSTRPRCPQASLSPEQCPHLCTMPHIPQARTFLHAGIQGMGWDGTDIALIICSPLAQNGSPVIPYIVLRKGLREQEASLFRFT